MFAQSTFNDSKGGMFENSNHSQEQDESGAEEDEWPGHPPADLPIDQHLPFLLLAATGIMVYVTYRRKSALK